MIPLEKQVCSLELSKRLKELGVKQESYFYWCDAGIGYRVVTDRYRIDENEYSAFTVAELGILLMQAMGGIGKDAHNTDCLPDWNWITQRWEWNEIGTDTEADARAKILINLRENRLSTGV